LELYLRRLSGWVSGSRPRSPRARGSDGAMNALVGTLAVFLCAVNAIMWTFVTGLPFMGGAWAVAAVACIKLQKWSWFPWASN